MSFWFDDKTGNRTSTAADQNTRHWAQLPKPLLKQA